MRVPLQTTGPPLINLRHLTIALNVDRPGLCARVCSVLTSGGLKDIIEVDAIAGLRALHHVDAVVVGGGARRAELLTAYKLARQTYPDTPMVGLWPDNERLDSRLVLRSGIDGVVLEGMMETSLAASLEAVCVGRVCFPLKAVAPRRVSMLTSREKQVLAMLVMGFSNGEIGRRLFLAESTVKSHLSSAYMKLGVRSRKDAAALILDPDEGLGTSVLAISSS